MAQHNQMLAQQIPPVFDLMDSTMKHPNTTMGQILMLTQTVHHQYIYR
jgi:hypothetical protein